MADREELLRLADEIAAASGADRELDALIAVALGYVGRSMLTATSFTASLDATMLLMPRDHHLVLQGVNASWTAALNETASGKAGRCSAFSATPALALAAASLRARAQDPLRAHGGQS